MFVRFRPFSHPRLTVGVGLTLMILSSTVFAQRESFYQPWRWVPFGVASGLPANQTLSLAETPSGTVWAGTQKGLAWYDGYLWHTIGRNFGIPQKGFLIVEPLGADSVLAATDSALFAGTAGGFTVLIPEGALRSSIQSVVTTSKREIFVLTNDSLLTLKNGTLRRISTPAPPMSSGRNLWKTSSGFLWLNTRRGLYRWDGKFWTRVLPAPAMACLVTAVMEDKAGNGLAAVDQPSEMTGIWEWSRFGSGAKSSTERSRFPQTMDASPDGTVIVVYQSGDVRIRYKGVWSSETAPPLAFATTHFVKYRKNGDLWLGTDEGLYLFRSLSARWQYWRHSFPDLRNYAHTICRTSDGSIWIGTLRGIEIHRSKGRVEYIEEILGTTLGTVTGITEDRQHNVWICSGANFEGAFRWSGRSWKHFGPADGLKADRVHKIRTDRSGRLWFLGLGKDYTDPRNQPGAFVFEQGKFTQWAAGDSTHPGLISGRVYSFAQGRDNALWFGTYKGLSRWKANKWTHWTREQGFNSQNSRVYTLAIDSTGVVWFSNETSGLGYVDKSDSVHFYTTDHGLVHNIIWDLVVDESNGLWISTRAGLSYFKDGIWSSFTLRNGLNSLSLWDILPLKDKVYIGTRGSGVNILNKLENVRPSHIDFSEPAVQGNTALIRWRALPFFGQMETEDMKYRYRVNSGTWSEWSRQADVRLTNLASGEHEFELESRGVLGILAEPAKTFIQVEPPLFRRPEVILLTSILAGAIVFLSGAYLRRERKYTRQLEQSDERFRLIASSTSDVIYDWNIAARAVWSNDPSRFFTNPSAMPGEGIDPWFEQISEGDQERVRSSFRSVISRRIPTWNEEYRYHRKDGTVGHILHRGQIFYDDAGNPVRMIGSGMDISDRKNAEELSRHLTRRILEAQEGERRRVSRELHDSVNQILASVKFRIESLEEELKGRSVRFKREAKKTKQLLNKVMAEVRRISRNLRPAELDDLGLASAVRLLAEEFTERTKMDVTLLEPWPVSNLSPEITETLYRIIQEALMNVEKHSNATRVTISFTANKDDLVCSISDNGRGMQSEERGKTKPKSGGLGIVDMSERLSFLNGTLEIGPRGKHGTTLTVRIPLAQQQTQHKAHP